MRNLQHIILWCWRAEKARRNAGLSEYQIHDTADLKYGK